MITDKYASKATYRPALLAAIYSIEAAFESSIVTDKGHRSKSRDQSIIEFWIEQQPASHAETKHLPEDSMMTIKRNLEPESNDRGTAYSGHTPGDHGHVEPVVDTNAVAGNLFSIGGLGQMFTPGDADGELLTGSESKVNNLLIILYRSINECT